MTSRHLLVTALTLVAATSAAAQPAAGLHRIGFINSGSAAVNASNVEAFRTGLTELGYIEGRNIIVDYRWADGNVERIPRLLHELLTLKPKVIVSTGGPPTVLAAKAATNTVPVVFITGDPLVEKIVPSMARPGGNLTGFALISEALETKRLQLLREVLPSATRIGVIWNPASPTMAGVMLDVRAAANRLNLTLETREARNRAELDFALDALASAKIDAMVVIADVVLGWDRQRIVDFANQHRLPGIYFWREFVEIGGLMSYNTNLPAMYRRAATYVDKILKGAKPGDLPVEQPTKFELVINLKAAKALGITIPQSLLLRADEVIQ